VDVYWAGINIWTMRTTMSERASGRSGGGGGVEVELPYIRYHTLSIIRMSPLSSDNKKIYRGSKVNKAKAFFTKATIDGRSRNS
jgi:hypothetical protein